MATEDELAAEMAAAKTAPVRAFARKRAQRRAFPEHLPRERVVVPALQACACCGSDHLVKLGEDITETLEVMSGIRAPGTELGLIVKESSGLV